MKPKKSRGRAVAGVEEAMHKKREAPFAAHAHLIRIADSIDNLRDMLSSAMDAYLSVSNQRANLVMKRLTATATILMSVTLIASIFGMNFSYMPELRFPYGYVGALATMLVVGAALYVHFRARGWLDIGRGGDSCRPRRRAHLLGALDAAGAGGHASSR